MAESSPLEKADILFISDGLTQFSGVIGAGCLPQWWSEEDLLLIALREQIRSVHGRKELLWISMPVSASSRADPAMLQRGK
jgi:hypothetical protein